MSGPLSGVTIIELAGLGPAPFAGMMLADNGATVIRVQRPGVTADPYDVLARSREVRTVDLRTNEGVAAVKELARHADGLIEGFRPGVIERLGIGPEVLLDANPALVVGRMTGWGQDGPYAAMAGHDLNYIALTGALNANRRGDALPAIPLNLVGDFGGGGMLLAFGMVSAILAARASGRGQVIDCAMTDGTALLMGMVMGFHAQGAWLDKPASNVMDTGCHFYEVYETADDKLISIAAAEPQFYALLREKTGTANDPDFDNQHDRTAWPRLKAKLVAIFRARTQAEWCAILEGSDVCFAPVLSMTEAPHHPHNVARGTYVEVGGYVQPAPAPRYSVTANDKPRPPFCAS